MVAQTQFVGEMGSKDTRGAIRVSWGLMGRDEPGLGMISVALVYTLSNQLCMLCEGSIYRFLSASIDLEVGADLST
jgi:hypothetical protein